MTTPIMNELNLHNRLPNDLPDKQTIKDILLELEDTKKFDIKLINLHSNYKVDGEKWYANNRTFNEWVERGEIVVCEIDSPVKAKISRLYQDESELFTTSFATIKKTRYNIIRYPMRLDIRLKDNALYIWHFGGDAKIEQSKEILETTKDVYLRLKDYLGPDVIQHQFGFNSIYSGSTFIIDFIISRVELVTPTNQFITSPFGALGEKL
jgi:hypothetical protein